VPFFFFGFFLFFFGDLFYAGHVCSAILQPRRPSRRPNGHEQGRPKRKHVSVPFFFFCFNFSRDLFCAGHVCPAILQPRRRSRRPHGLEQGRRKKKHVRVSFFCFLVFFSRLILCRACMPGHFTAAPHLSTTTRPRTRRAGKETRTFFLSFLFSFFFVFFFAFFFVLETYSMTGTYARPFYSHAAPVEDQTATNKAAGNRNT